MYWTSVLVLSGTYSELLDYVIFAALLFYALCKVSAEHINPPVSGVDEVGFNRPGEQGCPDNLAQASHFYFLVNDCPVNSGFSPVAMDLVAGYLEKLFSIRLKKHHRGFCRTC